MIYLNRKKYNVEVAFFNQYLTFMPDHKKMVGAPFIHDITTIAALK